ncbi:DUF1080 domain-containing protein [Botrimarina sp.]|uniref:3-keto-disaccharide hydrolase n=1 Tax=Botrimarina sp. TaxID=2795802 RepID=UPI0032EDFF8E
MRHSTRLAAAACCLLFVAGSAAALEYLPGMAWDEPRVVDPGPTDDAPPSDAVVLFGGEDLSAWENAQGWSVEDGAMVAGKGMVRSKEQFGDCQVHIEWSAPEPAEGSGQARGNSGVFLMGKYELQVLDSYDNKTYPEGQAGSIYKQIPPMVNAMRPPGEWNTYDIFWTCPKFADGELLSPATVTVVHNGVLVLNHFTLLGDTPYHRPPQYEDIGPKGPIALQDHGNPVRFRNIWVREIAAPTGAQGEPMFREGDRTWPVEQGAAGE